MKLIILCVWPVASVATWIIDRGESSMEAEVARKQLRAGKLAMLVYSRDRPMSPWQHRR